MLVVVIPTVVVSDEAAEASVGAKPAPANVIAAIVAQSCFVRTFMD
jgi:hypothetical protein